MSAGRFVWDPEAFELRIDGDRVPLEPQALDVLGVLLANRGHLVRKEDLLDGVWGDRFVSESALTTRIKQLRQALGDDGRAQRVIQTVHGRGYKFVGEVSEPGERVEDGRAPVPFGTGALPVPRTELVGRDELVAEGSALVGEQRLVTMLGLGGAGKTRLALAVARSVADRFPDGIWFVDLVPHEDADSIELALAEAAGLRLSGDDRRRERIAELLALRRGLLLLDNSEHVLDAVAELVDDLLDATVAPHVLVTSREPLDLVGEHRLTVPPLPVQDGPDGAVALLLAGAASYGVRLDGEQRRLAWRIAEQLDGLPLALELAAAQLRHLPAEDLADRLADRFDVLVGTARGAPRHASLTTILEDTWASTPPGERDLLAQLSALAGSFTIDDIEDLIRDEPGHPLRALAGLVDRSLVVRETPTTYRVLETVRAFADAADGDHRADRHARHAEWCAEQVGSAVAGHYLDARVARWCRVHHNDLRLAEQRLRAGGDVDGAALLAAAPALALHVDDGARAADALRRIPPLLDVVGSDALRARLHLTLAMAGMGARQPTALRDHGAAAVRLAEGLDDPVLLGIALVLRTWHTAVSDPNGAVEETERAGTVCDDAHVVAFADAYRSWYLAFAGERDEAVELAESVLDRRDVRLGYGATSAAIGVATFQALTHPEDALEVLRARLAEPLVDSMWANSVLESCIHAALGDHDAAARIALAVHEKLDPSGLSAFPDLLVPAALLAHRRGEEDRARRWIAAVRAAPRPTKSLQVTLLYRDVRTQLGVRTSAVDAPPLDEAEAEALAWLAG